MGIMSNDDPSQREDGLALYVRERLEECAEGCRQKLVKQLTDYDGWSEGTADEFVRRVAEKMRKG